MALSAIATPVESNTTEARIRIVKLRRISAPLPCSGRLAFVAAFLFMD
jgi:hypothetical protein